MSAALEELRETRDLVEVIRETLLKNYRALSRGTGGAPLAEKAAQRVEEALLGCMQKATEELAPEPAIPTSSGRNDGIF